MNLVKSGKLFIHTQLVAVLGVRFIADECCREVTFFKRLRYISKPCQKKDTAPHSVPQKQSWIAGTQVKASLIIRIERSS